MIHEPSTTDAAAATAAAPTAITPGAAAPTPAAPIAAAAAPPAAAPPAAAVPAVSAPAAVVPPAAAPAAATPISTTPASTPPGAPAATPIGAIPTTVTATGFPTYTNLVLTADGKLADLHFQSREVAAVIKVANTFDMPRVMMWDHPMPQRPQRDTFISVAVQHAARRAGFPLIGDRIRADGMYERLIISNTIHRMSNFRGSLKIKVAMLNVLSTFELEHVHGPALATAILSLTTPTATNDDNYACVYPFVNHKPDLTKPFCAPAIIEFLDSAFFHGPRAVCVFPREFYTSSIADGPMSSQPELPICMVAFGGLVVYAVLKDYQTGAHVPMEFRPGQHIRVFERLRGWLLNLKTQNPVGFHMLMAYLYQRLSSSVDSDSLSLEGGQVFHANMSAVGSTLTIA
ncbi:hypothetical protein OF83DRAFT_824743 [Amylostereum chailletii]|nr:hypothetical protein OF83DRAFT_824743 [Amylostereum chailletii]